MKEWRSIFAATSSARSPEVSLDYPAKPKVDSERRRNCYYPYGIAITRRAGGVCDSRANSGKISSIMQLALLHMA